MSSSNSKFLQYLEKRRSLTNSQAATIRQLINDDQLNYEDMTLTAPAAINSKESTSTSDNNSMNSAGFLSEQSRHNIRSSSSSSPSSSSPSNISATQSEILFPVISLNAPHSYHNTVITARRRHGSPQPGIYRWCKQAATSHHWELIAEKREEEITDEKKADSPLLTALTTTSTAGHHPGKAANYMGQSVYECSVVDLGYRISCQFFSHSVSSRMVEFGPIVAAPYVLNVAHTLCAADTGTRFTVHERTSDEAVQILIKRAKLRVSLLAVDRGNSNVPSSGLIFSLSHSSDLEFSVSEADSPYFRLSSAASGISFDGRADSRQSRDMIAIIIRIVKQMKLKGEEEQSTSRREEHKEKPVIKVKDIKDNMNGAVLLSLSTSPSSLSPSTAVPVVPAISAAQSPIFSSSVSQKELNARRDIVKQEGDISQRQQAELQSKLEAAMKELKELRETLLIEQQSHEHTRAENNKLVKNKKDYLTEKEELQRQYQQLVQELQSIAANSSSTPSSSAASSLAQQALQHVSAHKDSLEIKRLKQKINKLIDEHTSMKMQYEHCLKEMEVLTQMNDNLSDKALQSDREISVLKEKNLKLSKYENYQDQKETEIKRLQSTLIEKEAELRDLSIEHKDMKLVLIKIEREKNDLLGEKEGLVKEIAVKIQELTDSHKAHETALNERHYYQQVTLSLQQELDKWTQKNGITSPPISQESQTTAVQKGDEKLLPASKEEKEDKESLLLNEADDKEYPETINDSIVSEDYTLNSSNILSVNSNSNTVKDKMKGFGSQLFLSAVNMLDTVVPNTPRRQSSNPSDKQNHNALATTITAEQKLTANETPINQASKKKRASFSLSSNDPISNTNNLSSASSSTSTSLPNSLASSTSSSPTASQPASPLLKAQTTTASSNTASVKVNANNGMNNSSLANGRSKTRSILAGPVIAVHPETKTQTDVPQPSYPSVTNSPSSSSSAVRRHSLSSNSGSSHKVRFANPISTTDENQHLNKTQPSPSRPNTNNRHSSSTIQQKKTLNNISNHIESRARSISLEDANNRRYNPNVTAPIHSSSSSGNNTPVRLSFKQAFFDLF